MKFEEEFKGKEGVILMKWNLQEDPGSVGTFFAVDLGVDSFN